jgi:hypothetical protein
MHTRLYNVWTGGIDDRTIKEQAEILTGKIAGKSEGSDRPTDTSYF